MAGQQGAFLCREAAVCWQEAVAGRSGSSSQVLVLVFLGSELDYSSLLPQDIADRWVSLYLECKLCFGVRVTLKALLVCKQVHCDTPSPLSLFGGGNKTIVLTLPPP